MVGGERPLLPDILGLAAIGAKSPILNRYSLVAPQPIAKIVQLTLTRSPLRAFQ